MAYDFSVSNEVPNNSEQDRNIVPDCKTDFPAMDLGNIKGSIREFERWLADHFNDPQANVWPPELEIKAKRALLTLKSLDQPNLSPAFLEASKSDLSAFAAAHAEWRR